MNDYDKDIEEALDEAKINTAPEGDFESEIFLSTDGKHTVHVKADTLLGRRAAYKWAKVVYQTILEDYGTKQEQNVKAYDKEEKLGTCPNCSGPMKMSSKGKPYCSNLCWKK